MSALLDFRHFSSDGRLTYWTPSIVRRFLLEWMPRFFDHAEETPLDRVHEVVRAWLRFIDAEQLRDPRGGTLIENEAALDESSPKLAEAMDDVERFGVAKTWMRIAAVYGYDPRQPDSMRQFHVDLRANRVTVSEEHAEQMLTSELRFPSLGAERRAPQLPVELPSPERLATDAAESVLIQRLIVLVEWLAAPGRVIDKAGALGREDTIEAAAEIDLEIDADHPPWSSDDLADLRLLLSLAYELRLVRRYRGRLVRVAVQAHRLKDPFGLWNDVLSHIDYRARELFDVAIPGWYGTSGQSILGRYFHLLFPRLCNSLYSLPEATPVARLVETAWRMGADIEWGPDPDAISAADNRVELARVVDDLRRLGDVLEQLGAIERELDIPHPMFREDLLPDAEGDLSRSPFDPDTSLRLAQDLSGPSELVRLTDLTTAAIRERMLEEGREAGLVGELVDASAAEMLGVVAQHYSASTAASEIEAWLLANDADVEDLIEAARTTSFRSRAAAILELLYTIDPAADKLLRRLRSDPLLAPTALVCLVEARTLDLLDLTEPERQLLTAESSLRLMEMDGPPSIMDGLRGLSDSDARSVIGRVLKSGHPDAIALEEFRVLVAEPLAARVPSRRRPPAVDPARLGSTRRARSRRRRDES